MLSSLEQLAWILSSTSNNDLLDGIGGGDIIDGGDGEDISYIFVNKKIKSSYPAGD